MKASVSEAFDRRKLHNSLTCDAGHLVEHRSQRVANVQGVWKHPQGAGILRQAAPWYHTALATSRLKRRRIAFLSQSGVNQRCRRGD